MKSINTVTLLGNVSHDPEIKITPAGAVCTFGLATNRVWKVKNGERQSLAEFHNIVARDALADVCTQSVHNGKPLYVKGHCIPAPGTTTGATRTTRRRSSPWTSSCSAPRPPATTRTSMTPRPNTLGIALDSLGKGFAPIPVVAGTKIPVVKWKEWQAVLPPEELVREWFSARRNIAVVTSGMVVFDVDDPDKAGLVIAACGETPHMLRTPRGGVHLGYRKRKDSVVSNRVRIKGLPIDIRTDGGLELIADSTTDAGTYTWL